MTKPNDEQLLNCPFCGSKPVEETDYSVDGAGNSIYCENEHCNLNLMSFSPEQWQSRPLGHGPELFGMNVKVDQKLKGDEFRIEPRGHGEMDEASLNKEVHKHFFMDTDNGSGPLMLFKYLNKSDGMPEDGMGGLANLEDVKNFVRKFLTLKIELDEEAITTVLNKMRHGPAYNIDIAKAICKQFHAPKTDDLKETLHKELVKAGVVYPKTGMIHEALWDFLHDYRNSDDKADFDIADLTNKICAKFSPKAVELSVPNHINLEGNMCKAVEIPSVENLVGSMRDEANKAGVVIGSEEILYRYAHAINAMLTKAQEPR